MILHKYPDITIPQMMNVHPRLFEIVSLASFLAHLWYEDDLIVTAIYDPNHPGITHRLKDTWFRFVDAGLLKKGLLLGSERLRKTINAAYPHDNPKLQTIPRIDHKGTLGGSTADHFHFQIGPGWLSIHDYRARLP